jgi:hypothetical protein
VAEICEGDVSRYLVTLTGPRSRQEALAVVSKAPVGTRVEVKAAKRSNDQNALMWVLLTRLSLSLPWGGARQTPDTWKLLFLDALRRELSEEEALLPALFAEGGLVNVGTSSSDLSKDEMTMLIELILKFGAEHGVGVDDAAEAA